MHILHDLMFTCDKRKHKDWWAPGNYTNKCCTCGRMFTGDKLAGTCADCAYNGGGYND